MTYSPPFLHVFLIFFGDALGYRIPLYGGGFSSISPDPECEKLEPLRNFFRKGQLKLYLLSIVLSIRKAKTTEGQLYILFLLLNKTVFPETCKKKETFFPKSQSSDQMSPEMIALCTCRHEA